MTGIIRRYGAIIWRILVSRKCGSVFRRESRFGSFRARGSAWGSGSKRGRRSVAGQIRPGAGRRGGGGTPHLWVS